MNILEIRDLQYSYEKSSKEDFLPTRLHRARAAKQLITLRARVHQKKILRGINAEMEQGKMYVILGPSGCGKTTLLSLLGGLDSPCGGQILYEGNDIAKTGLTEHRRSHVAFIFQNYNLIDYLTPVENVALTAKQPPLSLFTAKPFIVTFAGLFEKFASQIEACSLLNQFGSPLNSKCSGAVNHNSPLHVLEQLGLTEEEAKRNVLKLSGGQQQRVAIARALASDAKVILADEPTGNLDEDTAGEIISILKNSAHKSGKCVVVVTHSNELANAADIVFRLKKGTLQIANGFDTALQKSGK